MFINKWILWKQKNNLDCEWILYKWSIFPENEVYKRSWGKGYREWIIRKSWSSNSRKIMKKITYKNWDFRNPEPSKVLILVSFGHKAGIRDKMLDSLFHGAVIGSDSCVKSAVESGQPWKQRKSKEVFGFYFSDFLFIVQLPRNAKKRLLDRWRMQKTLNPATTFRIQNSLLGKDNNYI